MYQKCQLESFIFSFSISGNFDVQKRSNTVLMCSCVSRSTGEPDSGTRPESEGKTNFCEIFFWNRAELWCWNTRFFHFLQCGQKGGIFPFCGIFGPKGGTDFWGWGSVGIIQKGGDFEEFHKNRKILLF